MEYIKLINRFWETNRNTQFTMAETTLYFYLLNEANRNYWQMPIACATAIICASTGMTKATLIRARNGLKKKGLIGFTEGVQHSRAPTYHIRTFETDGETADSTAHKTDAETTHATIIKDNNINKEISNHHARMSIDDLEKILVEDVEWHNSIISQLNVHRKSESAHLIPYIRKFFAYLRICKVTEKEESDCRSHFFNKMKKEYLKTNSNNFNKQNYESKRSIEVTVTSPQAYEGSF